MKKKKYFMPFIIILIVLEITSVFFICNVISDKETILDDVKLREEDKIPEGLAIMLETEHNSDSYIESDNSSWPSTGYKFNKEKSGCIDNAGNKIESSLSYDVTTNIATVETGVTTKCYIYFEKRYSLEELCESGEDTLGECLTSNNSVIESLDNTAYSGMYRYTGTQELVDDNYICFGTTDKEECINNPAAYMYRIIGVTNEDNTTLGLETGQVKLIKDTSIGEHEWHSDYTMDITWESSTIYSYLQGSEVLGNNDIMENKWARKIDSVKWNIGDVRTYTNGSIIYELESSTLSANESKLGLIYLSDYYYAYNEGGTQSCNSAPYCLSWITDNSNVMWTMSRFGYRSATNFYGAWRAATGGEVSSNSLELKYAVHPVFYLNKDEVFMNGIGTEDDPIMLREPELATGDILLENPPIGLSTTMEGGLYRYQGTSVNNYVCFGTNSKEECTSNTDAYMYRIIGINSLGQLKLIKKEALNTVYYWHNTHYIDIIWPDSDLFKGLNGIDGGQYSNLFIGNLTYMPTGWADKIDDINWKYGDNRNVNQTASSLYNTENIWNSTILAKIGLMYVHDYAYGLNGGNNCSSSGTYNVCKTAWIHLSNNDSSPAHSAEWTMSRYGYFDDVNGEWIVLFGGEVNSYAMANKYVVRPVFYLKNNVYITNPKATGASADPFLLGY